MRIVIIEDDPAIRQELTVLLQNALYEVTAPDEFDDAASAALSASPDLILLDVKLPGSPVLTYAVKCAQCLMCQSSF